MSLKTELLFDYLCIFTPESDTEFKKALQWINEQAFREGKTTYEMVHKILGVKKAGNKLFVN